MRSSFFNSLNGDRKYNATHWAEYFSQFIGNGVYAEPSTSMQVQATKGMAVKVGAGACFINGYAGYGDGADVLTLDLGTSAKRIDRIVIRLDYGLRSIYPAIIKGTAASSPEAPAIVRDGTYYDICIAEITVGINAAEITQSDIKDVRGDNTVCGWVAGTIDQIDTTELFAQYEAQWELLRAACDQDADAVISAWAKLNAVKKVNGFEPVGGNILLALNNIPDGGGYYKSGYYIQAGTVNITGGSATVTFDKAYSEVPVVFTSYTTSTTSDANPIVVDRTETGFTVKKGTTAGYAGFDWVAFGKLDETTVEEYDIGSEIAEHLQAADIHVSAFDKNKWNGYSSRIEKNKEEILSSKEDITALQAQDTLINSRLDNITKLPEGSTSGDAELADIRIGYDGNTYANAGDAVRSQIADVRQDCLNGGYTATGSSSYALSNAVDYPLLGLNLYGKSTQDGTPTPENPVEIVSVGDSGFDIVSAGDNEFTVISCIVNNDIITSQPVSAAVKVGEVATFSVTATGAGLTYQWQLSKNGGNTWNNTGVNGNKTSTITLPKAEASSNGFQYRCAVTDANGNTVISYAATFYVFADDIAIKTDCIVLPDALCGIPVNSDGNYTDSNGQQWICDELIYNADGTGKIVKRTASYTITEGINVEFLANAGSYQRAVIPCALDKDGNVIIPKDGVAICSAYRYDTYFRFVVSTQSIDDYAGCFAPVNGGTGNTNMRFATTATTAEQFISENLGVKIIYQRAEPQEIELTAAEIAQLSELQTFDGMTNISNSAGAEMSVKYCTNKALSEFVRPVTMGLQKQIDELRAAVLSLGGNV